MSAVEDFSKEDTLRENFERSIGKKLKGEEAPNEPPALSQILSTKDGNENFGILLERIVPTQKDNLMQGIAEGRPLTHGENSALNEARHEYAVRMYRVEKVKSELSLDEFSRVIARNPELQNLIGPLGAARAREVMHAHLGKFAMEDETLMPKILELEKKIRETRESPQYKALEAECRKYLDKYNITSAEVARMVDPNDPAGSRKRLREHVRKQYGSVKKILDVGGWISRVDARELKYYTADNIRSSLSVKVIQEKLNEVGEHLANTLTSDPELRAAIAREASGGTRIDVGEQEQVSSRGEAETSMYTTSEAARAGWKKEKIAWERTHNRTWASASATEKDDVQRNYLNRLQAAHSIKGRGFFSSLLRALTSALFAGLRRELT